jgi:hypothetical protein
MTATTWGGAAWIIVGFGAMLLLLPLGAVGGLRIAAIGRAVVAESGPLTPAIRQQLHHPLLWVSVQTRVAIVLGIVFLMTVKPALAGALLTIGIAIVLGLAASMTARTGVQGAHEAGHLGSEAQRPD